MLRSVDKCLSFFKVLKKKTCFGWDEEVEQAFQSLKEYLRRLPQMVSPIIGILLLVYLAVSDNTISMLLLVERDGQQLLLYYISHVLVG